MKRVADKPIEKCRCERYALGCNIIKNLKSDDWARIYAEYSGPGKDTFYRTKCYAGIVRYVFLAQKQNAGQLA